MDFLIQIDHRLFYAVHKLQKFNLDLILAWPTFLGSLKLVLPILFVFVIVQSRERILWRTFYVFFPVILSHQLVELMKAFFERPRPFIFFKDALDAVKVIFEPPPTFSFPSGHASTAFAAAIIFSSQFGVPRWAAFGIAVLICLTRLYVGVHFPSDLIAGALCGTLITLLCLHFLKRNLSKERRNDD